MILQPTASPAPSGAGLDVAGFIQQARQQGIPDKEIYTHLQNSGSLNGQPQAQPQDGAQLHDTGSFLGNVANSAGNLLGGLVHAVAHPIDTITNLGKTALGGLETGVAAVSGQPTPQDSQTQAFHQTLDYFKQRYGSVDNFLKTAYQDPVGTAADASILFTGVGGAIKSLAGEDALLASRGVNFVAGADGVKTIQATDAAQQAAKIGQTATQIGDTLNPFNAAGKVVSKVNEFTGKPLQIATDIGKKLANYATSQATGLNPETIRTVMDNPGQFAKDVQATYSRESLAAEVKTALDKRIEELQATGKEYGGLRADTGNVTTFDANPIPGVLQKYGITLNKDGSLIHDINSVPMSAGDLKAIQDFMNKYGMDANGQFRTNYTNQGFLNTRQAIDQSLINWASDKTPVAEKIGMDIRSAFDEQGKLQIKGLKELDAKYSEEVNFLKKVKKDYLNADGTLKDNAESKIANASNKTEVMKRLEKLQPGISTKLKVQAAIDDIERAGGQKVGAYARRGLEVFGAATLNPAMIMAAVLTSPTIAVKILRGFAKLHGVSETQVAAILKSHGIQEVASKIKQVSLPAARAGNVANQQ